MIQAIQNNLFIKVKTKYIGNITDVLRVAAIANGSSVDPTDIVNIVGEVISIPKIITTEKRGYEGFSTKDIQVGDTAIFRFDLIYEFKSISKTEKIYKNRVWYKGEELWSCDIQKVFGVIRDGEIIMVNGYVMLTDFIENKIVLPNYIKRTPPKCNVLYIGSPKENEKWINAQTCDTVLFDANLAAKYQIWGKPFRIIQQNKILGKEI